MIIPDKYLARQAIAKGRPIGVRYYALAFHLRTSNCLVSADARSATIGAMATLWPRLTAYEQDWMRRAGATDDVVVGAAPTVACIQVSR